MFFVIFSFILLLPSIYVGWRLTSPIESASPRRHKAMVWAAWLLVPGVAVAELARLATGFGTGSGLFEKFSLLAWFSLGLFSLVVTLTVLRDLAWLALRAADEVQAKRQATALLPADPARRRMLLLGANLGVVGAATTLAGVGTVEARSRSRVVNVKVPIRDLPQDLEGFTIAQLSDIHVGPTIRRDYLAAIVDAVNELSVDLIAVTGDLVDGSVPHLERHVAPLAELRARHGVYFVTGNHEYYSGAKDWVRHLDELGLVVLGNEHRVLEQGASKLLVAGVNDYTAGSFFPEDACAPDKACHGAPPCGVRLLLAHQPKSVRLAAGHGYDLMLSGHTHAGQFFPWNLFVHLSEDYVAGLYRHDEKLWVYVNSGTGYWGPPLRLGTTGEITRLTLTKA